MKLLQSLIVFLFGTLVIYLYYFQFNHLESFSISTLIYTFIIGLFYFCYKYIKNKNFIESGEKKVSYSYMEILGVFLINLLILSILFFGYTPSAISDGIMIFFKIIFFLILPTIIVLSSWVFGKKILSFINGFSNQKEIFQNILSIIFGFSLYISILSAIGILGFYNLYTVFITLIAFCLVGYRECLILLSTIVSSRIETKQEKSFSSFLFSSEFLFIIISFIISINFINILRPLPIGWDDLGVYMNYPQLFAQAGEVLMLGGMHSWQVLTGIGYLFQSPTQAFFINVIGGVLSFSFLWAIFNQYFQSKNKLQFINIPLLLATIFTVMPMVIFQQAKDIKHDIGLFFISIGIIYIVFELLKSEKIHSYKNKLLGFIGIKNKSVSSNILFFTVIGFILGFTFTLKATSLLLILGIIGVIFFARFGLIALFGYISIFVSLFTAMGFWKFMNIIYTVENTTAINIFSILTFIAGVGAIIFGFLQNTKIVKSFLIKLLGLFIGMFVAVSPWVLFNISASDTISVSSMLSGKSARVEIDYSKIYNPEELTIRETKEKSYSLSATGTTANEDWGRYLGYQEGINNFVWLPYNLSMQANQAGEFTDITYLYFALLPLVLLFLPVRKRGFMFAVAGIFVFELLLFFVPGIQNIFQNIFSTISFPFGYLVLFIGFLIPFFILISGLKENQKSDIFKYNLVFSLIYIFLWTISAYGVVWYGIVMYFNLLLVIGYGLYYAMSFKETDSEESKQSTAVITIAISLIIGFYFIFSVLPHGFKNLQSGGYSEFKKGEVSSLEAPYLYNSGYLKILFETNIHPDKQEEFIHTNVDEKILKYIDLLNQNNKENKKPEEYNFIDIYNIEELESTLRQMRNSPGMIKLHQELSNSLKNIYTGISHPSKDFKNTKNIYRIGTFLKYYISENHKRLLEDSLVIKFYSYILGGNPDQTIQNMKDLGLEYFLVDLNAATIDNDPRKNLTTRYESLLRTFTSEKLELISSDSKCLLLAREQYLASDKSIENYTEYLLLAGVNYDSYDSQGNIITRNQKRVYCYNKVLTLIENGEVSTNKYSYLLDIQNYLIQNPSIAQSSEKLSSFIAQAIPHGYKVFFKIK